MHELTVEEVVAVNGGLTTSEGGLAIMALAFAGPVGLVTAAALGIGLGLLLGPSIANSAPVSKLERIMTKMK